MVTNLPCTWHYDYGISSQASMFMLAWQMSNHARWSVLQAFNMLKEHKKVHGAIVQELEKGSSLASLIDTIETTMAA